MSHMSYVLKQVSQDRYNEMRNSYIAFQEVLNDPTKDPVNMYSPRDERQLAELELIRGISKELMKKKEEDAKKAAQAAEETKEEKSEDTEEKPETEETQQEENKE